MVEEEGTVIRIENGHAIVAVVQTSACQSCKAKQGCGQAALSEWGEADRQAAKNHFSIPYSGPLSPGDRVLLGIAEDTLAMAALWIYLWPLAAAFAALVLVSTLSGSEPLQLVVALTGGTLAFAYTRRRFRQAGRQWTPRILAVEPVSHEIVATVR